MMKCNTDIDVIEDRELYVSEKEIRRNLMFLKYEAPEDASLSYYWCDCEKYEWYDDMITLVTLSYLEWIGSIARPI